MEFSVENLKQRKIERQSSLFSLKEEGKGDEDGKIDSETVMQTISNLFSLKDSGNLEQIQQTVVELSEQFLNCMSLSISSLCEIEFNGLLLSFLENPQTPLILQGILTILYTWIERWPSQSDFLLTNESAGLISAIIFNEETDQRSLYLAINLLSAMILLSPEVKSFLVYQAPFVNNLVNAFFNCPEEKIRDAILNCLWAILHTKPHPSFSAISDITKLFMDLFTDESPPNLEKRLSLASVFAECDANCAFVICDIFPIRQALDKFETMPNEIREHVIYLIYSIINSNDSCSTMAVLGSMSWNFFHIIANLEPNESSGQSLEEEENDIEYLKVLCVKLICMIFNNPECTDDFTIYTKDFGVFEVLINWSESSSYQLRRWCAIALMQVLINKTEIIFDYFILQNNMFQKMHDFLEFDSIIVTKEVLKAIIPIYTVCNIHLSTLGGVMDGIDILTLTEALLDDISAGNTISQSTQQLIDEFQEKLLQLQSEVES